MTNQLFCYWLQGYFEICKNGDLTKEKILIIKSSLMNINEPLGYFTQWLTDVINFFASQEYRQELLSFFLPEIISRLNSIFHHVIDNSYNTVLDKENYQRIHDGNYYDQ